MVKVEICFLLQTRLGEQEIGMKRVKEFKKLMILAICGLLCISSVEVTNVQAFSVKKNSRC